MVNRIINPIITEYSVKAPVSRKHTFAFVSDLHHCDNGNVLSTLDTVSPDEVLVGGDFIHNMSYHTRGLEFLRLAAKRYPVFCALGNHEYRYEGDIRSAVTQTGARLVDNSFVGFKDLYIGGLTSGWFNGGVPDTRWLERYSREDGYKILICHHPEYFKKYIRQTNIHLTLSGHAHGGQWRFFGRGVYSPGQGIFPKYTSGIYENRLIVGRGLGNPHRIPRINNPPEVLKISLIPKE